jgi:hypothetical protein
MLSDRLLTFLGHAHDHGHDHLPTDSDVTEFRLSLETVSLGSPSMA